MKTKSFYLFGIAFLFMVTLQAQTYEFWGMTSEGGVYNSGCIFKTDTTGQNQSVVFSWYKTEGANPTYTRLIETDDSKFYGMTQHGGVNGNGILFEYDPATSEYGVKVYFDGTDKGRVPNGSLILATDGKLYGMTKGGGTNGKGVIFSYDYTNDSFTKLFDFDGVNSGSYPYGSLFEADDGMMYGTASEGGANDLGVLFGFDPATNTFTKILDFDGAGNGEHPLGSLIQADDGYLYGTTFRGGTNGIGVLFRYDPAAGIYTKIMDFVTAGGSNPRGLMQAGNGKIYGLTMSGGSTNNGVLYEFDPATDTYTKKADLDINTGSNPRGTLLEAGNGKLYGLTYGGGANGAGTLIEYTPATDALVKKMDFEKRTKGENPLGTLIQASDGKLYGMTYRGGTSYGGVLFDYDIETGNYQKLLNFNEAADGKQPYGSLLQTGNGKVYGMTGEGGAEDYGVLFEFDPFTSTYTKLFDFDGEENGGNPFGSLIQADNELIYGMTPENGANYYGIIFTWDPETGDFTKIFDFDGTNSGGYPYGGLTQADNGKLYGMTYEGGTYGSGVIFEIDPATNTFTKLSDFDGENTGGNPNGSLLQAGNGKLYGTTSSGGQDNDGTLFEFDPSTNTITKKVDFTGNDDGGILPLGDVVQAGNGKLYGMTMHGGTNGLGTLFEFDPVSGSYEKKIDFDGENNGALPYGSLLPGGNGKLYGMTGEGGASNLGVLFEYDPATNTLVKTLDFDNENGAKPYGNLVRVSMVIDKLHGPGFARTVHVYPVPTRGAVNLYLGADYRNMKVLVRNAGGKLIKDYGIPGSEHFVIQLNGSAGIYFVEVINGRDKAVYKVVKR